MANTYTTLPGQLVDAGLNSLVDLANKYEDNQEIAGLVAGTLADTYRTQVNTGQSLQYNDAYLGSLSKYQEALENLRKGNTMELMGQEGAITERLAGQQISGQKDIAGIQADTARYGYDRDLQGIQAQARASMGVAKTQAGASNYASEKQLAGTQAQAEATKYAAGEQAGASRYAAEQESGATRYAAGQQAEAAKYAAGEQAGAQRYTAEQSAGASRYAAEAGLKGTDISSSRELEGQKFAAEKQYGAADITSARQLEGTKFGFESQERQIGLTGEQERKTLAEKYAQEVESQKALRADARGAIARTGARFYG